MHTGIGWKGKVYTPFYIFCMFQTFYRFPNNFQLFSFLFFILSPKDFDAKHKTQIARAQ